MNLLSSEKVKSLYVGPNELTSEKLLFPNEEPKLFGKKIGEFVLRSRTLD